MEDDTYVPFKKPKKEKRKCNGCPKSVDLGTILTFYEKIKTN